MLYLSSLFTQGDFLELLRNAFSCAFKFVRKRQAAVGKKEIS